MMMGKRDNVLGRFHVYIILILFIAFIFACSEKKELKKKSFRDYETEKNFQNYVIPILKDFNPKIFKGIGGLKVSLNGLINNKGGNNPYPNIMAFKSKKLLINGDMVGLIWLFPSSTWLHFRKKNETSDWLLITWDGHIEDYSEKISGDYRSVISPEIQIYIKSKFKNIDLIEYLMGPGHSVESFIEKLEYDKKNNTK